MDWVYWVIPPNTIWAKKIFYIYVQYKTSNHNFCSVPCVFVLAKMYGCCFILATDTASIGVMTFITGYITLTRRCILNAQGTRGDCFYVKGYFMSSIVRRNTFMYLFVLIVKTGNKGRHHWKLHKKHSMCWGKNVFCSACTTHLLTHTQGHLQNYINIKKQFKKESEGSSWTKLSLFLTF